ncbi:hypothetical protein A3F03_01700 [Candidatus Roizmanbacteria bacterium RIFCSPHIGHO2_12_FULL_41_11]|uniref:Uncharacterized protein n=1 Tax=Candidatus Roizmanbacteria bacterium RIFCSPHIGHO2_12_FULL_41_11 TaxID=1802052 RepID=A0A1F7I093_9BACT|nr:MAG: hypothetical protein A3F03_01700 [Candidatus Roizmanbacteria bacterium RIFCSPHIGHO2_12_FULL_41_11]
MGQTITVPTKTIEEILSRLDRLTREIKAIKTKLFEEEPPYGSDEWWKWSNEKAIEDYKKGRYTVYENAESLIRDLHKGK